ncbi:YwiC-like family protein [Paenibacillus koleovorans]|uniref:YwiC-like family protein n=1 Tax=Paenibacillus koleovorans TaxID=121608 RepID=UPI000FD77D04|nr:YwiC-like family protein [Paenibacillus koleovorans]
MKKRSVVIPHEHGGWAMVSVPFLLGMLTGKPQWMHVPLFLAWLFLYLSSYPFLQAFRRSSARVFLVRWGVLYSLAALAFLIPTIVYKPSLLYFGLPVLVLLLVNMWHAKRKSERAIVNDLCAILIFSIGGAAAYSLGDGGWDRSMAAVVLFSFLHFTGSAFFVKTIFRERGNKRWLVYARLYHLLLLVIPWAVGYPTLIFAYIFSAARAFFFAGKPLRPWKAGILEIVGVLQFLILSAYFIRF